MYTEHFGINEKPFSIAPDPRYLYMSEGHREAYAHLLYGIKGDSGFVLLTGEVGTGKTTICRCLLEQIPENSNIAIIFNPKVTTLELLASVCDELGIKYPEGNTSIKVFVDKINTYLLAANAKGEKTVLIIDEAQNLEIDVLEQVRLLTNLETNQRKLLQIIMLGQPELLDMLSHPNLRQLAQRITARFHLGPLSKKEIPPYIAHRLAIVGFNSQLFPASCITKLYKMTGGIPRLINILCDRALLGIYVQGKNVVDVSTLKTAAQEAFGEADRQQDRHKKISRLVLMSLLAIIIGGAALAATFYKYDMRHPTQSAVQEKNVSAAPVKDKQLTTLDDQVNSAQRSGPIRSSRSGAALQEFIPQTEIFSSENSPLQWPQNQPQILSQEMGYKALFEQWGVIYTPEDGVHACRKAEIAGLRCLHMQGSLESLIKLNRPAMLQLLTPQNEEFYGTLIEIKNQTATIFLGMEPRKIALQDIAVQWYGHYMLLWRSPPDYPGPIRPGYQGEVVQWLAEQLMHIYDQPIQPGADSTFNEQFVKKVKKFQFNEGLVPDGVVGPQTLIHLNTVAGIDVPTLIDKHEDTF